MHKAGGVLHEHSLMHKAGGVLHEHSLMHKAEGVLHEQQLLAFRTVVGMVRALVDVLLAERMVALTQNKSKIYSTPVVPTHTPGVTQLLRCYTSIELKGKSLIRILVR